MQGKTRRVVKNAQYLRVKYPDARIMILLMLAQVLRITCKQKREEIERIMRIYFQTDLKALEAKGKDIRRTLKHGTRKPRTRKIKEGTCPSAVSKKAE